MSSTSHSPVQIYSFDMDSSTDSGPIKHYTKNVENKPEKRTTKRVPMFSCLADETFDIVIDGQYRHDLDILAIHDKILRWFQWLKTKHYINLKSQLSSLEKLLSASTSVIQRKYTISQIESINSTLSCIDSGVKYKDYVELSSPYIDAYKKLGSLTQVISFEDKFEPEYDSALEDSDSQAYRHCIITGYLAVARKFISLDIIHDMEPGKKCSACNLPMDSAIEDPYGNIVCPHCSNEEITIKKMQLSSDTNKISNSRNNYEDRENFKKAIRRFQGIQNNKPPDSLYRKLDSYFKSKSLPSSATIKALPLDNIGHKAGTSRKLMYKALAETKNSTYYEDINFILHSYWGWALPDISHLEERIMRDYDLTQTIYDEIPKNRKSCLNSQFRLLKHLLRYKDQITYPIRIQDFKIPTTRDIIEWHEETWDKICSIARSRGHSDWNNIPIL